MKRKIVVFTGSGGRRLVGVLREPDAPTDRALLTVHGWGAGRCGPNDMLSVFCRRAAEEGFASMCFDLSGRGDSDGDPSVVTVDDMIDDTVAAGRVLAAEGYPRVFLFGLCSGGNVALGAASCGAPAAGIIAASTLPFVPIADKAAGARKTAGHLRGYALKFFRAETWRKLLRGGVSFGGVLRTLSGRPLKGGAADDRSLKDTRRDVLGGLASFKGRIAHIYGGADAESTPSERYFAEYYARTGRPARFLTLSGANHNFYGLDWRDAIFSVVLDMLRESEAAAGTE
jgi:pimeloyl-ACP methyl ester carboxylesterase